MIYSCLARWYEDPFQPVVVARVVGSSFTTLVQPRPTSISSLVFPFLARFLPECLLARLAHGLTELLIICHAISDCEPFILHPRADRYSTATSRQIVVLARATLASPVTHYDRRSNERRGHRGAQLPIDRFVRRVRCYNFVPANEHESDNQSGFSNEDLRVDREAGHEFDYLPCFSWERNKEKGNQVGGGMVRRIEKKRKQPVNERTRGETPSPPWNASCPSRRHPPSSHFIPLVRDPDVFR